MSPRRRDADSTAAARTRRRAELLGIAADIFAERGYAATTIREVADAAGMLAGSLYYHFDSKESMADEILSTFLTELWESYDRILQEKHDPRQALEALIAASFTAIDRHRPAVVLYQNESKHLGQSPRFAYLDASHVRFRDMWVGLLERGVREGAFRSDLDVPLAYRFLRDTVWVAANWYTPGGRLTADTVARTYLTMILEGIQPGPS
ncbi:AcrR family transcriptional regulator [Nocardiopsis mwathae]|uniref:AcrR family transcriptional regulator n=1 Tax=Nocardiopsis mwathae TaxID=1472723 RepID=A0A7W9YIE6_9ACTN|nr:TetR/AcrR family transcriptional regulator [Nocardiopsis mwathae]MBB6172679.1 AcrR family transcriptional regulator [Nocardiopsis mwathae]